MIEIFFKSVKGDALKLLDAYKPGCWVQVTGPSQSELTALATDLKLDPDILKDSLDPHEVSRVEKEAGSDYVFVRSPQSDSGQIHTSPLLVIIAPDYFVTVSKEKLAPILRFQKSPVDIYTTQKTKLFIQLLLEINSEYSRLTNEMRKNVRNFTSNLEGITNKDIIRLVNFESAFNDFLTSLEPLSLTLKQLLSGKYLKLYDADADLVEDLQLGIDQLVKLCVSNLKAIANIREAYTSIISNNLNRTMKLLTAVTLILTIPTAIASFFGMNVALPFANHPQAFIGIIVLTLLLTVSLWVIFWKRDYL